MLKPIEAVTAWLDLASPIAWRRPNGSAGRSVRSSGRPQKPGAGTRRMTASEAQTRIRIATAADAPIFGQLLHAFNAEFGEPEPTAGVIAERAAPLIESGELTVLFAGGRPDGFAQHRRRT